MKKNNQKRIALSVKLATKICEPYMTSVLYACYQVSNNARDTFEEYCLKVKEKLQGDETKC